MSNILPNLPVGTRKTAYTQEMYLCTGFRQDFLPRVRVDTKWVHKLLVTEWSVSHEIKKTHIVTKDVAGLHRRDSKYKTNTSSQRMWLAY